MDRQVSLSLLGLKTKVAYPPILQYQHFKNTFTSTTNASDYAYGSVLSQGEIAKDLRSVHKQIPKQT